VSDRELGLDVEAVSKRLDYPAAALRAEVKRSRLAAVGEANVFGGASFDARAVGREARLDDERAARAALVTPGSGTSRFGRAPLAT